MIRKGETKTTDAPSTIPEPFSGRKKCKPRERKEKRGCDEQEKGSLISDSGVSGQKRGRHAALFAYTKYP